MNFLLGPPTSPSKPEAADVSSDFLTIYWKPPSDDGHSDIIEYVLEFRTKEEES